MLRSLAGLWIYLSVFSINAESAQVVCALAVTNAEGKIIGHTLLQPTDGLGAVSVRFPTRMNVAFSKDGLLVISDDKKTVTVHPDRPSQLLHTGAEAGRILHVNSGDSLVVAIPSGQIREWGLSDKPHDSTIQVYRKTDAPKFGEGTSASILGYKAGPEEKIAYLLARTEGGVVKYRVAIALNIGGRFETFYEYALPDISANAQSYVTVDKTLKNILFAQVDAKQLSLHVKPVGQIAPMEKRFEHYRALDFSRGSRMNFLPLADDDQTWLLGNLLVTNPLEREQSKTYWVGSDPANHKVAAFSPDGKFLAYHEAGSSLELIETNTGKIVGSIGLPGFVRLAQIEFSPDGENLAIVGYSFYPRNIHNRSQLQILKTAALKP